MEENTNHNQEKKPPDIQKMLQVFGELNNRMMLASQMGMQYSGNRDVYQALGYDRKLSYADYFTRYQRQDIAKAIIDRPVRATWQGSLEMVESTLADDTEFELAWQELDRKLGIKTKLSRVDKLTGIGRYGVLLLGLSDVKDVAGFAKPISSTNLKLLYLKPFGEHSAKIDTYESNVKSERYGLPLFYNMEVADIASGKSMLVKVHFSRIIHITDDNLESEVYGAPRLEAVYNRLVDLEKIVGGDAEMFWRSARPGFKGKLDPEYTLTKETQEGLEAQFDEYENNFRRFLVNEGVDIQPLTQQIADPSTHVDVQIQMISSESGIPKRILTGSERGELASTQDSSEWKEFVDARRSDHAEPRIVRPTIDRFIELGILPTPSENYTVKWQDVFSVSEKSKVEIGKGRANALREYTSNPIAQAIIPPKAFNEFFLGFTTEQITLITKMQEEEIGEELMDIIKENLKPPEPPSVVAPGTNPKDPAKISRSKPAKEKDDSK